MVHTSWLSRDSWAVSQAAPSPLEAAGPGTLTSTPDVAKCAWPWWPLLFICMACLGSILCDSPEVSASETLHLEKEHALILFGLKKGKRCFFITLCFCPIGFYALHGTL